MSLDRILPVLDEDANDDEDQVTFNKETVKIKDKKGKYQQATSIHDRYGDRPSCLKDMCLTQFASAYTFTSRVPATTHFIPDGSSENRSTRTIFGTTTTLPNYAKVEEKQYFRLRQHPAVIRTHASKRKEGHEQYFTELQMFFPWKNEEDDLHRKDISKCQQLYKDNEAAIQVNRKEMFPGELTVDLMDLELSDMRPSHVYDTLNPQGEQDEEDDRAIGIEDDPQYSAYNYNNLEPEQHLPEQHKYKTIEVPDKDELLFIARRLCEEQQSAVQPILNYCKQVVRARKKGLEPPEPVRLIITGGAGNGKTATTKTLAMHAEKILRQPGSHPHKPRVLIVAPTGKAASLIGGLTYHSALDLQFGNQHVQLSDHKLAQFRENLSELTLIILDDYSLLGADMLYKIHMRLREIFQCDDLFANKSFLLVGDILQLKPVLATFIFNRPYNNHFWGLHDASPLYKSFTPIVLTKNHRQGDASVWADVLNRIREGIVTQDDEALLRTRLTTEDFLEQDAMHVMYTNKEVKEHNEKMFNTLNTESITVNAIKLGPKNYPHFIQEHGVVGTTQMMDVLNLKIDARVRVTTNINTSDELVNGSMGTVVGFEKDSYGNVEFVIVSFDDTTAGKIQRQKYNWISSKYEDRNGTPIALFEQEYQPGSRKGYTHAIRFKVIQFPLKLAWASTAHSMQGVTVKKGSRLIVHFSNDFQPGMAYVMLSRCERLQDIYITGDFNIEQIKCHPEALEEYTRITQLFQTTLNERQEDLNCLRITYLNAMSLLDHVKDVKQSSLLMSSTVLGLAETWMDPGSTVDLPEFQATFENVGRGKGLAAFYKEDVSTLQTSKPKVSAVKVTIFAIDVIFLYISQKAAWTDVLSILEEWLTPDVPTTVMGDMNDSTHQMKPFLESKGFQQMIRRATHDKGNCIDHLYLNQELLDLQPKVEQQSVYFSDHDIITMSIPEIKLVN
mgnify:CR=1 FL=1